MSTLYAFGDLFEQGRGQLAKSKFGKAVADINQVTSQLRPQTFSSQSPTRNTEESSHKRTPTESTRSLVENTTPVQTNTSTGQVQNEKTGIVQKVVTARMQSALKSFLPHLIDGGAGASDILDGISAFGTGELIQSSPSIKYTRIVAPRISSISTNKQARCTKPRENQTKQLYQARPENEKPVTKASRTQQDNHLADNENETTVTRAPIRHDSSHQARKENEMPPPETSSAQVDNYPTQNHKEKSVADVPKRQEDSYRVHNENEKPVSEEPIRQEDNHPAQQDDQQSPTESPGRQDDHHQPATTTGPKEAKYPATYTGSATTDSLSSATVANVEASANQDPGNDVKTGTAEIPKNNDEPVGEGVPKQSENEPTEVCYNAEEKDANAAMASVIEIPREEYQALKQDVESLKNQVKMLEERPPSAKASGGAEGMGPEGSHQLGLVWVVPEIIHKDVWVSRLLRQLAQRVHEQMEIRSLPSSIITFSYTGNVILPVIAASEVGRDIQAAMQKAKLEVPSVVVIFNHLAPHNSRIQTPTKDRLSDCQLVESCQDVLDVVFWNGRIYDCEANTRVVHTLRGIWKISSDN